MPGKLEVTNFFTLGTEKQTIQVASNMDWKSDYLAGFIHGLKSRLFSWLHTWTEKQTIQLASYSTWTEKQTILMAAHMDWKADYFAGCLHGLEIRLFSRLPSWTVKQTIMLSSYMD